MKRRQVVALGRPPAVVQRIAVFEIAKTDHLWGPDPGRAGREAISEQLHPDRQVIALDMAGLVAADATWSRAAIGELLVHQQRRRCFYLDRASRIVSENVDAALFRHGLCILSRHGETAYDVLGKAPSAKALDVLAIVERQHETTTRAICSILPGLAMTACNNRLRDLLTAGLVAREAGPARVRGKEFIYRRVAGRASKINSSPVLELRWRSCASVPARVPSLGSGSD